MEWWVVVAATALVVSAAGVAGGQPVGGDTGPVTGVLDAVSVAVDVSPEPLPRDRYATLHVRVRNTETETVHRVVVTPVWPDGSHLQRVEFGQSGWELRCSSGCRDDPRLAISLAPGDTATANVTLRVPTVAGLTSLLGVRAAEDFTRQMLLAKQVPHPSQSPGDGWIPDLSVLESLAVVVATVVAIASLALRLLDRHRSGS